MKTTIYSGKYYRLDKVEEAAKKHYEAYQRKQLNNAQTGGQWGLLGVMTNEEHARQFWRGAVGHPLPDLHAKKD